MNMTSHRVTGCRVPGVPEANVGFLWAEVGPGVFGCGARGPGADEGQPGGWLLWDTLCLGGSS